MPVTLETHHVQALEIVGPAASAWHTDLPAIRTRDVLLRELREQDAPALLAAFAAPDVARFMSLPGSLADARQWLQDVRRERVAARGFGFAIVPRDSEIARGFIRVRALDPGFTTAEWQCALSSTHWGTAAYIGAARSALDFAFDIVGINRVEARIPVPNGRAHAAAIKLGAVREGVLRRSFRRRGEVLDQVLWSIVRADWQQSGAAGAAVVH